MTTPSESWFSASFGDARRRFRSAVEQAGGVLETYPHPNLLDDDGELLSIDVGLFGPPDASRLHFSMHGVHGVESFSGSAVQLAFLDRLSGSGVDPEMRVVLVHGIDPHGWCHLSSRNEDHVDLNRNFIDFSAPPVSDEFHLALADRLAMDELSFAALGKAWSKVQDFIAEVGQQRFNRGLIVGQYLSAAGMKFGGSAPTWANGVVRGIARKHLAKAVKIAFLDWHVGLGAYGDTHLIHPWARETESWRWTVQCWGDEATERAGGGVLRTGDAGGNTGAIEVRGHVLGALQEAAPQAVFAGGVVEFGTAPPDVIFQSMVLDRWLTLDAPAAGVDTRFWRNVLRTIYAPPDPLWQASVLGHAEAMIKRTLAGLARW